jgi:hypothetical protein
LARRHRLDQSKLHGVAPHSLNARQPHRLPIAQFVALSRLGAQYPPKMMRGVTAQRRPAIAKALHEKSPSHTHSPDTHTFLISMGGYQTAREKRRN